MKTLTTTILLLLNITVLSQTNTFTFAYDNAGNRIQRKLTVVVLKSNEPAQPQASDSIKTTAEEEALNTPKEPIQDAMGDIIFKLYPNPTKGQLALEIVNLPEGAKGNGALYDYSGRTVLSISNLTDYNVIDLSTHPSATYILRIIINGEVKDFKIIKE